MKMNKLVMRMVVNNKKLVRNPQRVLWLYLDSWITLKMSMQDKKIMKRGIRMS